MTTETMIGRLVRWREEDGSVAIGSIKSARIEHHAGLDMDLTHVVIEWADGNEPTQHTYESLVRDPRVEIQ